MLALGVNTREIQIILLLTICFFFSLLVPKPQQGERQGETGNRKEDLIGPKDKICLGREVVKKDIGTGDRKRVIDSTDTAEKSQQGASQPKLSTSVSH